MNIIDAGFTFKEKRTPINKVQSIVIHHPVANWTAQQVHDYHRQKWSGIGYNYYVQRDGSVYYGRSSAHQEYQGAHCKGYNDTTLGVCAEGNFEVGILSDVQFDALVNTIVHLCKKHRLTHHNVFGHKEMKGARTLCPGKNINLNAIRAEVDKRMSNKQRYPDVNPSRWSYSDIENLSSIDIIKGYKDGTFRPTEPMTREEVAVLLNRLYLKLKG